MLVGRSPNSTSSRIPRTDIYGANRSPPAFFRRFSIDRSDWCSAAIRWDILSSRWNVHEGQSQRRSCTPEGCQQLAGRLSEAIPPVTSLKLHCTLEGCQHLAHLRFVLWGEVSTH